jgi:hypothetical protein
MSVAAQSQASNLNQKMAVQQASLEHGQQQREFIVEKNAALKDANQASLEGDRARSLAVAGSSGMTGSTSGLRMAEQGRQTALSIQNAKDRSQAAGANYALQGNATSIATANKVATMQVSPLAAFSTIATAGLQNYGAFG